MSIYPSQYAQIPEGDLMSWNTDRDVEPVVMTRGVMYKTGGVWYFWDGQSRSADAGLMRVSSIGGSITTAPLSCDGSSVSAFQDNATRLRVSSFSDDAGLMRVSAVGGSSVSLSADASGNRVSAVQADAVNLRISAFSDDAALMRVSAVGVTVTGAISANQSLSARMLEGTAFIGQVSAILKDNPVNATYLGRVSAVNTVAVSSHEVKQSDGAALRVSTISEGANLMRVSVIGTSAVGEGTAFIGQVSATLKAGTASIGLVSATLKEGTAFVGQVSVAGGQLSATMKEGSAFIGQVSAILKDNPTNATYLGRVSGIIDSGSVSAKSGDATQLRISSFSDDAGLMRVSAVGGSTVSLSADAVGNRVSAFSDDAGLMRVSAVGIQVTGGISANESLSALMLEGSAHIGQVSAILVDNPTTATYLGHVSAYQPAATDLRVSTFSLTASTMVVSAAQNDAGLMHVSALGVTLATAQTLSATMKEGSAFIGQVSAILKDNPTNATYLGHVSAYMGDAVNLNVSAKSGDAGTCRTSSYLPVDTVGSLTVHQTLSISASQSVKATAGTLYGYYLFNTDTKPNYVKLYNVSAAANIGTDTPIMTICLPASAAANAWFGQGLKGFTAGINITATSGRPLDNTAAPAASAVGGNLFYN